MRPALIILHSPGFDNDSGFQQRAKDFPVQTFIAQLVMEALDEWLHLSDTKTTDGRWNRSAATSDLPTIAFFRASTLLRRNGPVPGILAAHWPGAIMDKSGLRFVVHFQLIEQPRKPTKRRRTTV